MSRHVIIWRVFTVTLVVLLAGVITVHVHERHAAQAATRAQLGRAVEALAPRVAGLLSAPGGDVSSEVGRWASASGMRVSIIGPDGRVRLDSWAVPQLLDRFENHLLRPEIAAAARGEVGFAHRLSMSTEHPTSYAARVIGPIDRPLGFLRVAREDEDVPWPWGLVLVALLASLGAGMTAWTLQRRRDATVRGHLAPLTGLPLDADIGAVAADVARRMQAQTEGSRGEQESLHLALAEVAEGVVLLDAQGTVRVANPAASRLLGEGLAVGRPLVEAARSPHLLAAVHAVLGGAGVRHTSMVGREGAELVVRVCPVPTPTVVAALVVHDCSEQKQMERARRALVADLAHELRTPLTVLGGIAEELVEERADPDLVASLERQVRRLQTFAEELEELAAIESGQVRLRLERVDAAVVARQVIRDLDGRAAAAEVATEHDGEAAPLSTDGVRLAQVLTNLVDNGIRYNLPGGRVVIRTTVDGGQVRIVVEDDGIGIPAAEIPLVFQRFYRVQRQEGARAGAGLGLAIVKHLVRALGGAIDLASEEGRGTRVTLTFPAAPA